MAVPTCTMPARSVPLDESWDVIVVGGGPAGCAAAAAAAREGARTLLIEATGSLGGMGTSALVPAWCPFSDKERIIYRGLAEKVFNATKAQMPHVAPDALDWVAIDAEVLKRVYDDLLTAAGATVLFNTTLAAVEKAGERQVDAIFTLNKGGLWAFRAKVYVDCTGDADLCAWAGAAFEMGDEAHDLMPATHCFVLANVDDAHVPFMHASNPNSPLYAILKSGKYPEITDAHCCPSQLAPGILGMNAGHLWKIDGTNPWSTSQALMQGRKLAAAYRNALAEQVPAAFADSVLVATGSMIGIRETRRVRGDYVLTTEDYLQRRSFADEICRNSYFIDVHPKADRRSRSHADEDKWDTTTARYGKGESHGIPYRCLTPRDLSNVLVAGRSISCEREVQGSVRVMPVCLAMGEAAGMAAAHAAASAGNDVHKVSTGKLRARLQQEGAYLPPVAEPASPARGS